MPALWLSGLGIAAYMPKEVPWGHRALHPCIMRSVSWIFMIFIYLYDFYIFV